MGRKSRTGLGKLVRGGSCRNSTSQAKARCSKFLGRKVFDLLRLFVKRRRIDQNISLWNVFFVQSEGGGKPAKLCKRRWQCVQRNVIERVFASQGGRVERNVHSTATNCCCSRKDFWTGEVVVGVAGCTTTSADEKINLQNILKYSANRKG